MRALRQLLMTVVTWLVLAFLSTGPGTFTDCYERATWDGTGFVGTGEWRCLGR